MANSEQVTQNEITNLAEVVERARTGDREAWNVIFRRYDYPLRRIARMHGLDEQTVGDVVQQTWLAALSQLGALRCAEALAGWLYTIVRRECRRTLAHRKSESARLREIHSTWDSEEPVVQIRSSLPTPEDAALQTEQHALLRLAWDQLSRRDQDLLILLMDERRPAYSEISLHTGLPIGSIGPTRGRCLARLRGELKALGVDHRWTAA